jgi:heme/copper-type cytochrome/quinol oxidase subunit 3
METAPPLGTAAHGRHRDEVSPRLQAQPVTPGKVAMWLFLATEVMFFTGLIGPYIVLRAGSPHGSYSRLYPPETDLKPLADARGVILDAVGPNHARVLEIFRRVSGLDEHAAEKAIEWNPTIVQADLAPSEAQALADEFKAAGARVEVAGLNNQNTFNWPRPYDALVNPLSIDLTAFNTFILICSSVTMVLALSAIQRGHRGRMQLFLGLTILIGGTFLSIQVFEYYQLLFGHHYPPGISATGHFRPNVSLFASCFFTMTGFHGAHVFGGIVTLSVVFLRSVLTGAYTRARHSPVELVGLYWHFVDLVWIILFTVVYLI